MQDQLLRPGTRVRVVEVTVRETTRFVGVVQSADDALVMVRNPRTGEVVGVPSIFVRPVKARRRQA